jgi:hypothetical protein
MSKEATEEMKEAHAAGTEGENGLSAEDETAIQELLKGSEQDADSKQEQTPKSNGKAANGEDMPGRIAIMESRMQRQAAELSSVKQVCSRQDQVLNQLLEHQRVTNELLAQLANARKLPPQSLQASSEVPAPAVPAVPQVPEPLSPMDTQPILPVLPGAVDGAVDAATAERLSFESEKSDGKRSDEASITSPKEGRGASLWNKARGTVTAAKVDAEPMAGNSTEPGKNPTEEYGSAKSQGSSTANSLSLKIKALSAMTTPSKTPVSSKKRASGSGANSGAVSKNAMRRQQSALMLQSERSNQLVLVCQEIVRSDTFTYFFGVLIMANSVCIGLQADHAAANLGGEAPESFAGLETFFCFAFLLEIVLKVIAEQKEFIFTPSWKWNVFDCAIVLLALIEEISKLATSGGESASVNLTFVRVLRVLRIVRIIRLIRVLKVFRELRVLINSIMGSLKSLCWTILLLVVIMYVVAVYVTQVVAEHRKLYMDNPEDEEHAETLDEMATMFGSVPLTLYSLYKAMSGGADWGDVAARLKAGFIGSSVLSSARTLPLRSLQCSMW